jgi:hypothetical protein
MPPHYNIIALRPRTLEHILHDLRHARRDYDDALTAIQARVDREEYDAADDLQDRASEAETRFLDLQSEALVKIEETLGVSVEGLMDARAACLI